MNEGSPTFCQYFLDYYSIQTKENGNPFLLLSPEDEGRLPSPVEVNAAVSQLKALKLWVSIESMNLTLVRDYILLQRGHAPLGFTFHPDNYALGIEPLLRHFGWSPVWLSAEARKSLDHVVSPRERDYILASPIKKQKL